MGGLVDFDTTNDTVLSDSIGRPLEDKQTTSLGSIMIICRDIPGLAVAGAAEEMGPIQTEVHLSTDRVLRLCGHNTTDLMPLTSGLAITFTPPAIAALQSPLLRERQAWYMATIDDEHAVSMTSDGPLNLKA